MDEAASILEIRRLCADVLEAGVPVVSEAASDGPVAGDLAPGIESPAGAQTLTAPLVSSGGAGASSASEAPTPPSARRRHTLTDEDLTRFLRGRKGNIPDAVAAIRRFLEWREAALADEMLRQPFPDFALFRTVTPHSFHKNDMEGHPVYIERSGAIDVPKVLNVIDEDALVVRHVWAMELYAQLCREASAARGSPVSKVTLIFDLNHLSLSPNSTALSIFKATLDIDQNYYPERLCRAFFINSPWIFKGLWSVISPWIDPVTREKFHILGGDYKDTLLKFIAPDSLPVEYGGTCACGMTAEAGVPRVESCVTPICTLTLPQMLELAGYRTLVLSPGAESSIHLDLTPDGTAVIWQWHADDKDLVFRAEFSPTETESDGGGRPPVVVHSEARDKSGKGWFVCPSRGRIILHFSNKHSRFTSKTLHVRLSAGHSVAECRIRSLRLFSDRKLTPSPPS